MHVKIVEKIIGSTWITRNPHYKYIHHLANVKEKEYSGCRLYNLVNRTILKLPRGHLASKIKYNGDIIISREFLNLIPEKYRLDVKNELIVHEKAELKEMLRLYY